MVREVVARIKVGKAALYGPETCRCRFALTVTPIAIL
jgi:hypothetical protein